MIAGEILLYGQFQHRIGQLDFIASPVPDFRVC
jgi:hypothetical protein